MNIYIFSIIYCWILVILCQAGTWICDYQHGKFSYASLLNSFNITAYSCPLKPYDHSNMTVTKIIGRHSSSKNDYYVSCLDISYKLETFSSMFCLKFNNLISIWIENAEIKSFNDNSLQSCGNLKFINIDGNKLRELPRKLFAENFELSHIVIQNNKLATLSEISFQKQKKLQLLNLEGNKITILPTKIFDSLVKLQELSLYSNKLQVLDPELFMNLKNLTILNLAENQLNFLPSSLFQKLVNLQSLSLDGNKLQALESDLFVNLRSLKNLTLTRNQITEMPDENLFKNQAQLEFLDLERNQIIFLPSKLFNPLKKLQYLIIGNNRLQILDPKWFINLKNLKGLALHDNEIWHVTDENYFPYQNVLENLRLDENQISFIPSRFFHPLVYLQYLDLESNKLQIIDPKWFENLKSLEILVLNKNEITRVSEKSFKALEKLSDLYLYGNKITTLSPDCFVGLQKLNALVLSENEISDLPSGIFVSLKSLKELHMHNNSIAVIGSDLFGNHDNLEFMDLMNNKITAFDENVVRNTAVRYLNMTNNLCYNQTILKRDDIKLKMYKCSESYRSRCGTSKGVNRNIISGAYITRGAFPWIAAVENKNGEFLCTGTLVTNKTVVTAASCILDKKNQVSILARNINVILGAHNLNDQYQSGRSEFEVECVHLHSVHNRADIAVLVLKQKITFSNNIEPVCLFSSTSTIESIDNGIVVGFNKNKKDEHENFATAFNISVDRTSDCLQTNSDTQNVSNYQTFCGRISNATCNIESGSGLYVHHNGVYYLRGITTALIEDRSNQCDENGNLIFTNMTMFTKWINRISLK